MKAKIKTWLKRYLPGEIFGTIGALIGGSTINFIFHNSILTALGATWGENIGYYGVIFYRDLMKIKHKNNYLNDIFKVIRDLILEFGPSEYFDSFLIRPLAMYFFPKVLNNLTLGLIIGKLAADITFYIPTIIAFELRKKFLGDN